MDGWAWEVMRLLHKHQNIYDKKTMIDNYVNRNQEIEDYFKGREQDFIKIKVGNDKDFKRLMEFLNIKTSIKKFPWKNKTKTKK